MGMDAKRRTWLPWLAWAGLYLLLTGWFRVAYRSLTMGDEWAAYLYPEGHFFEILGAVSLCLAALFSFIALVRSLPRVRSVPALRRGLYLAMALGFLLAAGMEMGLGQHLVLRLDGVFSRIILVLALGLPAAWLAFPALRQAVRGHFPAALLAVGPFFLLNQAFAMLAADQFKRWYRYKVVRFPQALQEIKESNFELLCAVLALIAVIELGFYLKRRLTAPPPPRG